MAKILSDGTPVAWLSPNHAWVMGTVVTYDVKKKTYTCTSTDPEPQRSDKVKNAVEEIWAPRLEYLDEDVDDLLQMTELHEASILFCLKRRYFRDVVYTNIGPIVVALNPFNFNISWYKDENMPSYFAEGVVIERNLPHTWAAAHNTYWEMRENKQNQTIIISGESGAGKTEAAKIVVKYVGKLSTLRGTVEQQDACAQVNRRVVAASPILEAFGNAKTVRNDNSSRFGKFMKIQFDADGFLIGSYSTKYLLEKSRIITAARDERVYHSFYLLASGEDQKQYGLRNAKLYRVLNSGECLSIPGVDDAADYTMCKRAMNDVGIREAEQKSLWRIVAGILFFQNLDFVESETQSGKVSSIDEAFQGVLTRACELWDVNQKDVERELLTTTITARGESTIRPLSKAQATDARDTVSKSLYDWLFEWLVNKINATTDATSRCSLWIGLLDIFGFEDFAHNSFEQLCINLANETLQNHYNAHIFTEDMKECREEGIDTTTVQFVDNKGCIELLTGKIGVLTLLDEECTMPNGSERNYIQKINANFQSTREKPGHPFFGLVTGKAKDTQFKIKHYAGEVTYNIESFLDKNRDTLKESMKEIFVKSADALISGLVPRSDDNSRPATKFTVGGYFARQLQELMQVINSTHPHWIRCIKPHPSRQPRMFSHASVMSQLRSAGVLDTVKVRKAGFPIRFKKDVFVRRYRILAKSEDGSDADGICVRVFSRLEITPDMGQIGKTKLFLRQVAFLKLNHAKDEATEVLAIFWQGIGRGCLQRANLFREYVQMHRARILAEMKAREEAARRKREEEERRRKAEEAERVRQERLEMERRIKATIVCQKHVRGNQARKNFFLTTLEQMRANDEAQCDAIFQKIRSAWEETDRRVKIFEKRWQERERLRSEMAMTQDRYGVMDRRRAELRDRRDEQMKRIEEKAKLRKLAIDRELKAERERTRAAVEEQRKAKIEKLNKQHEQRKAPTQLGVEEQMYERLRQRAAAEEAARRQNEEMRRNAEAAFFSRAHQKKSTMTPTRRTATVPGSRKSSVIGKAACCGVRSGERHFAQDLQKQASREEEDAAKELLARDKHFSVVPKRRAFSADAQVSKRLASRSASSQASRPR